MATAPHWALRRAVPPSLRGSVRRVVDAGLSPALGSVKGTRSSSRVAITFDDGPDPLVTPALLEVLDELETSCTFFLLVSQCRLWPSLARAVADRGHEVALHGLDHARLTRLSGRDAENTLRGAKDELESLTRSPVRLYRPPYGAQTLRSYRAARRAGLQVAVWSADAQDWVDRSAQDVASDAVAALEPGGILLLHERLEPDPLRDAPVTSFDRCAMARAVVQGCRERGWEPGTVSSLVAADGPVLTAWFRP